MKRYCGIDLHSNNHWLTIIDEQDKRLFERRLPNDLTRTLKVLKPYQKDITGVAVESTFYAHPKIMHSFSAIDTHSSVIAGVGAAADFG